MIQFKENTLAVLQYKHSPHPYALPNFMDIFEWSMPFVIEKVTSIVLNILDASSKERADAPLPELPPVRGKFTRDGLSSEQSEAVALAYRLSRASVKSLKGPVVFDESLPSSAAEPVSLTRETATRLRSKVMVFSRMARMLKTLREENETVLKLKGVCPGSRLKPGLLLGGKEAMVRAFEDAKAIDIVNERRPE